MSNFIIQVCVFSGAGGVFFFSVIYFQAYRAHQTDKLLGSSPAGDGSQAPQWLQYVPENERAHWFQVICRDEMRQADLQAEACSRVEEHVALFNPSYGFRVNRFDQILSN